MRPRLRRIVVLIMLAAGGVQAGPADAKDPASPDVGDLMSRLYEIAAPCSKPKRSVELLGCAAA